MAMIAPYLINAFRMFKRPLGYVREESTLEVQGFVGENVGEQTLAGDMGQQGSTVYFAVPDLQRLDLFPPRQYDRVMYHGGSHAVQDFRIVYDGDVPVFVKLRCLG